MPGAFYKDEWPEKLETLRVDYIDRHLFTELLTYCTRQMTDGVILMAPGRISGHPEPDAAVERLIAKGLLVRADDCLKITQEWWAGQRSRQQIEDDRKRNAQYQDEYRKRGLLHAAGDHRQCTRNCPDRGKLTSKPLTETLSKDVLSSPLLSDLQGGEEKETTIEGSADPRLTAGSPTPSRKVNGPHVAIDVAATDTCDLCGNAVKSKSHQKVPTEISTIAWMAHKRGIAAYVAEYDLQEHTWTLGSRECDLSITWTEGVEDSSISYDATFVSDDPEALKRALIGRLHGVVDPGQALRVFGWGSAPSDLESLLDAIVEAREPRHPWVNGCCTAQISSPVHVMPPAVDTVLESLWGIEASVHGVWVRDGFVVVNASTLDDVDVRVTIDADAHCTVRYPWPKRAPVRPEDVAEITEILSSEDQPRRWQVRDDPMRVVASEVPADDVASLITAAPSDIAAAISALKDRREEQHRAAQATDALSRVLQGLQAGDAA